MLTTRRDGEITPLAPVFSVNWALRPLCTVPGTDHVESGVENQRLAYSVDNGQTVHKYDGNPVISSEVGDFRDPTPLWYEPDNSWRLVVGRISPIEGRPVGTEIYSSENLIDWTYESTYRSDDEAWECPDLFKLPVEGSAEMRWVLMVSPVETRTVEYHVGHFDGTEFTANEVVTADDGYDFYATQKWSNSPKDRGLNISWMNNWNYAMETIVGCQEAMTVPRTTVLEEVDDTVEVRQYPADEMTEMRKETIVEMESETIVSNDLLKGKNVTGRTLELTATIDPHSADRVGIRVREGDDQESVIVTQEHMKQWDVSLRTNETNEQMHPVVL